MSLEALILGMIIDKAKDLLEDYTIDQVKRGFTVQRTLRPFAQDAGSSG
jgi:hypothetical protein